MRTLIFVVLVGEGIYKYDGETKGQFDCLYTASAITDAGKWLAGAISNVDDETAIVRCVEMVYRKAPEMLSTEFDVIATDLQDPRVISALEKAFARLP